MGHKHLRKLRNCSALQRTSASLWKVGTPFFISSNATPEVVSLPSRHSRPSQLPKRKGGNFSCLRRPQTENTTEAHMLSSLFTILQLQVTVYTYFVWAPDIVWFQPSRFWKLADFSFTKSPLSSFRRKNPFFFTTILFCLATLGHWSSEAKWNGTSHAFPSDSSADKVPKCFLGHKPFLLPGKARAWGHSCKEYVVKPAHLPLPQQWKTDKRAQLSNALMSINEVP